MVNLPRQIALKSKYNDNYLRYVHEASQIHSFLQYSRDNVLTPFTKYEVEQAKSDPALVNIRCCYNNKYWVSKSEKEKIWIVAGAVKIEEDKSKWNCTLFQPIYDTTNQAFRFCHIHLGNNVCLTRSDPPYTNCLIAKWSTPDKDLCDLSLIIDWKTVFAIPKYVAFKGSNEGYLQFLWFQSHQYLQFSSSDIGDSHVAMETFTTKDGNIRFKSTQNGLFWRRSPNWIWADSADTTTKNRDTLFTPVKIDKDIFAFRNLGNNKFIRSLTTEGKLDCLNAASSSIDKYSRFQLKELLLSREIYNVIPRLSDSRIYDQTPIVLATQTASNGLTVPNTMGLNFKYIDEKSSTWSSIVSIKLGIKTTLKSGIPLIVGGEIKIYSEFSASYEWEETITSSTTIESTYQVTVPPMTTVTVSLLATKGTTDVPFSYTQRDTLINGETKFYQLDDGVYEGINNYNFKYETKSTPITA